MHVPEHRFEGKVSANDRIAFVDYLRAFAALLVVLHHTALAYVTWGYLNPYSPLETFSPIIDGAKWSGVNIIVGANDTFFMPLLFLRLGLHLCSSEASRHPVPWRHILLSH